MTRRLYYDDSFVREFEARVASCAPAEGGRWHVVLEATAFYPTAGGQPHDTGRLGQAAVVEVLDREDGEIVHVTDAPCETGATLSGVIDWERRFDHIQQHTGQHIISAAFLEQFAFPTVSFHLGRQMSTIDVVARSLVPRHLEDAERRANEVVFDDRPVTVSYGTTEDLARTGICKAVEREGPVRVLTIEGFDRQACGGTHAARTGQVGPILLRRFEKHKQNWRIEFVCGHRALGAARSDNAALAEAARLLSCGWGEVPSAVSKVLGERQESFRRAQRLTERVVEYEAQALLAPEAVTADGRTQAQRAPGVIVRVFEDADAHYLRLLAARLVAQPDITALLGTRAGAHLVFAQSPGLPGDLSVLLRECLADAGGKGGGTKDFAQGRAGKAVSLDALLARAATKLGFPD